MAAIEKRGDNTYRITVSCGMDKTSNQIRKRKTIDLSHIKPGKQLAEAEKQYFIFKKKLIRACTWMQGK